MKKAAEALLNDAVGLITEIGDQNPNKAQKEEAVLETISTGLKEGAEDLADIEVFNRQKVTDQLDASVATLKQA